MLHIVWFDLPTLAEGYVGVSNRSTIKQVTVLALAVVKRHLIRVTNRQSTSRRQVDTSARKIRQVPIVTTVT